MKQRSISVLLMFAVVLFVAVSLGGCGGSSNSAPNPDSGTTEDSDSSMSSVWNDGEAMNEVFDRLTSADLFKMFVLRTEEIVREADGSITMQHFDVFRNIVSNEEYPKVPYNKDELLAL